MNETELKISDDLKINILKQYIEPSYSDDVNNLIKGKKCWRKSGQVFETISKIFVAIGGVLSFSSGYFNNPSLSFVAGSISTLSLALLQFSSFSYAENRKQSQELNIILKKLDFDTIPILERNNEVASARIQQNKEDTSSTDSDKYQKEIKAISEKYEEELKKQDMDFQYLVNQYKKLLPNRNSDEDCITKCKDCSSIIKKENKEDHEKKEDKIEICEVKKNDIDSRDIDRRDIDRRDIDHHEVLMTTSSKENDDKGDIITCSNYVITE